MNTASDGERLQKYLAQLGLGSRREIETWIAAGRLVVNGQVATLGVRVTPADEIKLDGRAVRQRAPRDVVVFLCNRSPGEDLREAAESAGVEPDAESGEEFADREESRPSMVSRLPRRAGRRFLAVSPMPRVDGGLELLTSDGDTALKLQRGVRAHEMQFSVRIKGALGPDQLRGVESGQLDRPGRLEVLSVEGDVPDEVEGRAANQWYRITARGASGKDIRQLFERQGVIVSRILRTAFGPVLLDRSLPRGQHRELTTAELTALGVAPAPREAAKPVARRNSGPSRRGSPGPKGRRKGR